MLSRYESDLIQSKSNVYNYQAFQDPEVRKKLIPNYEIGCKRVTPHDYYAPVRW